MIIDIHTHVFPDKVAPKALDKLVNVSNFMYPPVNDMTLSGLIRNMDNWGIDISVVQPVVTNPAQFEHLNNFARDICSDRIISFGGLHPDTEDYKADIDHIVKIGLKGIKFHAEYQNFILDEDRMLRIYDYAIDKGLVILHHAGFDPCAKPPFKTSPERFINMMNHLKGGTIIAAHFGGHDQWDDVEKYLAGSDIYLDTCMGFEFYGEEKFLSIAKKHGCDKILFGSDSPWSSGKKEIEAIKALPLTDEEKDNILGLNAKRILGL